MAFTPLNSLNAFVAVARHRSYAAAARELGISGSALSQSVRQLETRLGVSLLARTSRSVAPTQAGERLLQDAGPAVDQAIASLKAVTSTKGEVSGRLRLTVPTVAASQVLAVVLPRFIERYPEVDIEIRVEDRFVDAVAEGFDAGIRLVEAIDRDMVHVQLTGEARVVVAGAPSYFERAGVPQAPADLQRHICVNARMAVTGAPFPWEFERGKKTWKVNVHGPVSANDFELNKSLAISGVGLLYCLEPSIAGELARKQLRLVLEPYAATVPGLFLYFPSRAQLSPALKAFVGAARELAKKSTASR
jgi:DNA-binding transcriptional LysR family regulator